jgi:hypothetical protein
MHPQQATIVARPTILGLLKLALWPAASCERSSTLLLMFWSASERPGAVMSWWDWPVDILISVIGLDRIEIRIGLLVGET